MEEETRFDDRVKYVCKQTHRRTNSIVIIKNGVMSR